jgi:formylglycine-generating enzyme required for sulfatase activity
MIARCALLGLILAGCKQPLGEALIIVDTDAPVPQLVGRLRVDLYSPDGAWYESRDILRNDPGGWPSSFGIYNDDPVNDKVVLVRLRAYPDGATRDYQGERFRARPEYQEPFVAHSVAELCANPPELPLGKTLTVRRGRDPIFPVLEGRDCCMYVNQTGSAAARITVPVEGDYRIGAVDFVTLSGRSFSWRQGSTQVALQIRSACADDATVIDCEGDPARSPPYTLPMLNLHLKPGTYYLVVGGSDASDGPDDIALGFDATSHWASLDRGAAPPPTDPTPTERLELNGNPALTPLVEPQPNLTIDRLLLVRMAPGVRGSARVLLAGACFGTMARLAAAPLAQTPVLAEAETCVDAENVRVPLGEEAFDPDLALPSSSQAGQFGAGGDCDPDPPGSPTVCIPGGVFILGRQGFFGEAAVPERVGVIPRFFIDRYEVTMGRWRQEDGWFFTSVREHPFLDTQLAGCPGSASPMGRENFGLACIPWYGARAFCQHEGGDLPSAAQWEYAAAAAGRPARTLFPWGDEFPDCGRVVSGRAPPNPLLDTGLDWCNQDGAHFGPVPVDARPEDATPQGVIGMGGGLQEWVLDSYRNYDDACWRTSPLLLPHCWEDEAPFREIRGGRWDGRADSSAASGRKVWEPGPVLFDTGFRCAYASRPQ